MTLSGIIPGQADKGRRSQKSKDAILAATFAVLQQKGFRHLTIEGVAANAGVGKTTIYRWWSSKGALAVEAMLRYVSPEIEFNHGLSARDAIGAQIRRLALAYAGPSGRIVREMLGAGQTEPETLDLFMRGYLEPRRAIARAVLHHGMETGEFRKDIDPDIVIDALYGPIHVRSLLGLPLTDERFLTFLQESILEKISVKTPP